MPKAITETLNIHEVVAKGCQRLDDVGTAAAVAAVSPNGEARTTAAGGGGGGGFAKVGHMANVAPKLRC